MLQRALPLQRPGISSFCTVSHTAIAIHQSHSTLQQTTPPFNFKVSPIPVQQIILQIQLTNHTRRYSEHRLPTGKVFPISVHPIRLQI